MKQAPSLRSWCLAFSLVLSLPLAGARAGSALPIELVSRIAPARISDSGNGGSGVPEDRRVMSADGRYLVFASTAGNLIAGAPDLVYSNDIFLFDRVAGTTTLVSHTAGSAGAAAGGSRNPTLSADGRYVAYVSSATNLVAGQSGPARENVVLFDRLTGANTLASHAAGQPAQSNNGTSFITYAVLSADGRYIAYTSNATDLVAGHAGSFDDVFLYDRDTGANLLVSRAAGSTTLGGSQSSQDPSISSDGRYVAFQSDASNLVPGQIDTATSSDIFVFDRQTAETSLASRRSGFPATAGSASSRQCAISADGRFVAFSSSATDLVAGHSDPYPSSNDVFLYDRSTGSMVLASHAASSATTAAFGDSDLASISADGSWVLILSRAPDLVAGQTGPYASEPHLFLYERASGTITLVDHTSDSATKTAETGIASVPVLSSDGRYAAFVSLAGDLVAGGAGTAVYRLFLFDRSIGANVAVAGDSWTPAISDDGAWMVFNSDQELVSGKVDSNGATDVFLQEISTGSRRLVSERAADQPSVTPLGDSAVEFFQENGVSADGRYVPFLSAGPQLIDGLVYGSPLYPNHMRSCGSLRQLIVALGGCVENAEGEERSPHSPPRAAAGCRSQNKNHLLTGEAERP